MGRYDAFGGRKPADPRDFMAAQREMRTAAEAFCRRHHLRGGYQVFACADAGGSMLDDVESVDMVSR
jgi:uncharacterized protein (DUF1786 family)